MWSDEREEMIRNIKQGFIWAAWYLVAWVGLMVPVVKVMIQ